MSELTREQKRIRIAEACGWTQIKTWTDGDPSGLPPSPADRKASQSSGCDPCIPDYFGSLDAMHDALKLMTKDQCNDFNRWIIELRGDVSLKNDGSGPQSLRWSWGQSAEIVAEAFGKATKLW